MIADFHGWWGPGWGLFAGLAWAAFWVLVILIVVGLVRGRGSGAAGTGSAQALRLLEERYARGEIDREEFLERRDVLAGRRDGADR